MAMKWHVKAFTTKDESLGPYEPFAIEKGVIWAKCQVEEEGEKSSTKEENKVTWD